MRQKNRLVALVVEVCSLTVCLNLQRLISESLMETRKFQFIIFLFMLLLGFGCEQTETSAPFPSTEESQRMINFLVSDVGFNRSGIVETPTGFVVEGDVFFAKDGFWEDYSPLNSAEVGDSMSTSKHYRSTYKVSPTPKVINVGLSPTLPSAWQTAFNSAITSWNALQGKVTFNNCNCCDANGVWVTYSSLGSGTEGVFAQASGWPTSAGKPASGITVNSACTVTMTSAQKKKTAAHELGHTIGLMHTDVSSSNLITTASSACNTGTDVASVMRQGLVSFVGFSTCDIAAIRALYP